MIDYLAIGLTHFLLALVALRLTRRGDLDRDLPYGAAVPVAQAPARPAIRREMVNPLNPQTTAREDTGHA